MRRNGTVFAALLALVLSLLLVVGAPTRAHAEGGHDSGGLIVLEDLDVAQRQLAREAWSLVICNCPKENWSKTLLNCPDGCADPQKQEILHRIEAGWTLDQILEEQVSRNGPRVLAKPDDVATYLLPLLVLGVGVVVVGMVFAKWKRDTAARKQQAGDDVVRPDDDELAAVEAELREMR